MRSKKRVLRDAKLYVILDTQVNSYAELLEIVKVSVKAGADILQLRDKSGSAQDILKFSKQALKIIRGRALFIVNDRVDLAKVAEVDGVHCGQSDLTIEQSRALLGSKPIIGVSCQTLAHARKAQTQGADYLGFGSVYKTLTKPDRNPMEIKLLKQVVEQIQIPVFAIGGINLDNVRQLTQLGINRVAVCRAICKAKNPVKVIKTFKEILSKVSLVLLLSLFLTGCVSTQDFQSVVTETPEPDVKGVYHKVSPKETLWRIAKTYEVAIDDIIAINNIPDAAQIEKNQLIFIPGADEVKAIIIDQKESDKDFIWPIEGKIITYFHESKENVISKGIDILTQNGTIVRASRTGRVIFADKLVGYGQTVILDHEDGFFSVYSNNATITVKLGDLVLKKQPIAHVATENNLAYLHFQIRKNSLEDNPLYYLP